MIKGWISRRIELLYHHIFTDLTTTEMTQDVVVVELNTNKKYESSELQLFGVDECLGLA